MPQIFKSRRFQEEKYKLLEPRPLANTENILRKMRHERRFQPITLDEPTPEETLEILKGIRDKYEAHHRVKISDKTLEAAVNLSIRYISDRFLPDKAIDLIDEAASRLKLKNMTAPPDVREIEEKIEAVKAEKEAAITTQEYEGQRNSGMMKIFA